MHNPRAGKKLAYGLNFTKPPPKKAMAAAAAFAADAHDGKDDDAEFHDADAAARAAGPLTSALDRRAAVWSVNRELARGAGTTKRPLDGQACQEALELDPSVFDYDGVYDQLKEAERKGRSGRKAEAEGKKREREAEGDEYAGTESFTTSSYKAHKDELARLEDEEKQREGTTGREDWFRVDGRLPGEAALVTLYSQPPYVFPLAQEAQSGKKDGFFGFYRTLLDQASSTRQAAVEASVSNLGKTARVERPPEKESAAEAGEDWPTDSSTPGLPVADAPTDPTRKKVLVNADGEVVDKRQLLRAGLNVTKKPVTAAAGEGSTSGLSRGGKTLSHEEFLREQERRAKLNERFRKTTQDVLAQKK
ncbi:MAG: hypothetical protein BJ554DRAFT_8127, partial [Olpidium bornovanus]